jgi:hypothetical protein
MLRVYAHQVCPGVRVEYLASVTHWHLPNPHDLRGDDAWRAAWEVFSPVTHTERNRQLVALYGLDPVREYADCVY